MADDLAQVLADGRERAAVLRAEGHPAQARSIEEFADRVQAAAEDYLTWLPEDQAALQSGHSVDWLRVRFAQWEAMGHAKRDGRQRKYRALIVPRRARTDLAYRAGQRAGEAAA